MEPARLFVYGSLQPGGSNEHVLHGIEGSWRSGSVRGRLLEKGWGATFGYPAVVLDQEGDPVPGFVFESDELEEHWERLDAFEGSGYRRVRTRVDLEEGGSVEAFVYVLRQ